MCDLCGARTQAEHENWVIQFYEDRKGFWLDQGNDMAVAVKMAMLDVDKLGVDA